MEASRMVTRADHSLAQWATGLWIGACVIGAIEVLYVPGSPLQGHLHVFGFLVFCGIGSLSATTLRQIVQLRDGDPAPMWRRALFSSAVGTVAFLMILGPIYGAVPSLLALGAVSVAIVGLRGKQVRIGA
jgi:hypothetical protein